MTGQDTAREVANKLRTDGEAEKQAEVAETALVKSQLDMVRNNPELAKMYGDNARVGAENLGGDLPILKVQTTGKSSTNELPDGREPEDGYFFYQPKQMQFKELTAHILTISRGYYAEGMEIDKSTGKKKAVWNQIMGGVITNDGLNMPFVMYVTGKKLQPMWDFGKAAGKYTRAKPVSIPMFALSVRMTTEKMVNSFGKSWIIGFDIVKGDDGFPAIVTDAGEFQFLLDMVDVLKETIEKIIASKEIEDDGRLTKPLKTVTVEEAPAPIPPEKVEEVTPDDIPF